MRWMPLALSTCVLGAAASAEPPDERRKPVVTFEELHPKLETEGGELTLELVGFFQLEGRSFSAAEGTARDLRVRRARAKVEGALFHFLEYEVDVDLAADEEPLRDAYVNAAFSESLQLRVGKAKLPFSQEEQQSSRFMDFGERSPMNNLIPDRSFGVEVHGELEDGKVSYETGLFGVAVATSGGHELLGRLKVRPFEGPVWEKLSFGGAVGRGSVEAGESFQGRSGSRSFTFFEPVSISGRVSHDNLEAAWFFRSTTLNAEWIRTRFERRAEPGAPDVVGRGVTFGGAWILTGEVRGDRGIAPRRPVLDGGPGAVELVARYERLAIDDGTEARRVEAVVLGANWWLSRALRLLVNASWDRFENASQTRDVALLTRVQVIF